MTEPKGDPRRALGRMGEERAAAYLTRKGYAVLARNWRTRAGELDIIARDGVWLVFVEVRTRRAPSDAGLPYAGTGEESVTRRKQQQLVSLASAYLYERPWPGPWRIDVIALDVRDDGSVARLNHLQDAVGGAP